MHNLFHVVPEMKDTIEVSNKAPTAKGDSKLYSNVNFICQDIDAAASLVSAHIYFLSLSSIEHVFILYYFLFNSM